ncbi:MAG TPA: T9SS type A sorting domain-containing protein [Bacteroidales bacterium]|nr:T9SS type A sorting domain-containing protein [Bacteroidales bacterium]
MKKQLLIITVFFLSIVLVQAQQSRFPIKTGSVWRINFEFNNSCDGEVFVHYNGDEEYKYFIDGDTVVGTRTYFKLYKTGIIYLETPFLVTHKYMGAIRDSADRIYYMDKEDDSEKMLYDFTVEVGDTIQVEGGMEYPVSDITTLPNGRKQYVLDIMTVHCGSANTFIEGIGWLGGLLEGNSCSGHPGVRGSYLVCYSEDGEVKYQTEQSRCYQQVACGDIILSPNNPAGSKVPVVVIMPGGKMSITLSDQETSMWDIKIFNTSGQLSFYKESDLSSPIDISMLEKGVYVVKLSNNGISYSSKFVIQ